MKRKITYGLLIALLILGSELKSQQLPIFSQYVFNAFILNPAMAGYDGYTSINTTARQQWLGIRKAPQTVSASFQTRILQRSYKIVNSPIRNENVLRPSTEGRVGLGGYIINDSNGDVARTGMQFAYAYHIQLGNHQLSFGLAAKLFQFRIDEQNLTFGRDVDPLANNFANVGYTPDLDFGMLWTNQVYFIGVSVSNLFESVVSIGSRSFDYRIDRHYWVMGSYRFDITREFFIEPTVLMKTTERWIPQADLGAKFYYTNNYWGGLAFRTDGSLIFSAGMQWRSLYIGYAFDYSFSRLQRFNLGTHEISISYKFGDNAKRYRWLRRY
ncbi:type IX secretion system membrane protein PorP/SprF [Bacteroidota bacterium]